MARHIHTESLIFCEEDGYIKRVFDLRGNIEEGHSLIGARVLGGVAADNVFHPTPKVHPLAMLVEGDHLCLDLNETRLVTGPVTVFMDAPLNSVPTIGVLPPNSVRVPRPPGFIPLPPPIPPRRKPRRSPGRE